jgi:hypothetical protein
VAGGAFKMNMTNGNGFGVSSTSGNSGGGGNGQKRRTVIEQLNQGINQQ